MRKNASSRTMDEELKIFLGTKPEVEEQKPAPVPAGMPAQEHEDVQAGTDKNMDEQIGETVQENTDGSPQVVHRVSGKQRRASLDERVGTDGEHCPPPPCHLRGEHRGMA